MQSKRNRNSKFNISVDYANARDIVRGAKHDLAASRVDLIDKEYNANNLSRMTSPNNRLLKLNGIRFDNKKLL